MFKPIHEERKTFSKKVVDHIKELITTGQLREGEKLPSERELAEMMQVSRPTIREAFKILSALGYVDIRHGHGVFVANHSVRIDNLAEFLFLQTDTIHELFEVRKMIETESIARAVQRSNSEYLQEITAKTLEIYHRVIVAKEFSDPDERENFLSRSDQEFHLMIAQAAGNEVVLRVMNNLIDLLRQSRMRAMKIPGRVEQSLVEHIDIAKALSARDEVLARKCMLLHLDSVEQDLVAEINDEKI